MWSKQESLFFCFKYESPFATFTLTRKFLNKIRQYYLYDI